MVDISFFTNKYALMVLSGLVGILITWITQRILNKRGVFSYFVTHNTVGTSTTDPVFGKIDVTWNGNQVQHLFLSSIELKNESLRDYENILIKVCTGDTSLLSESTNIVGTPEILEKSERYRNQLDVAPGQTATDYQVNLYFQQREYVIPVFNRGQIVRMSYLNDASSDAEPNVWLSATVKGVVLKFRTPQIQAFGVPQPHAGVAGTVLGFFGIIPLVMSISTPWLIAMIALIYGLFAQFPGACLIKGVRKFREIIGN